MTHEVEYHRPQRLDEALALLGRADRRTVPLAGGSRLAPQLQGAPPGSTPGAVDAVVDLADLGLNAIALREDAGAQPWLCVGATATLSAVAENPLCRALAGGVLAQAAHDDLPPNTRNTATVGGCVVSQATADPGVASRLALALAALDAQAVIVEEDCQPRTLPVIEVLADPGRAIGHGLVVELRLPWLADGAGGGLAHVVRTPADQPMVAAAAVSAGRSIRVAVGGVAGKPVLLRLSDAAELESALAGTLPTLDTPDDFRGSALFRRAMAAVVARRALAQATTPKETVP